METHRFLVLNVVCYRFDLPFQSKKQIIREKILNALNSGLNKSCKTLSDELNEHYPFVYSHLMALQKQGKIGRFHRVNGCVKYFVKNSIKENKKPGNAEISTI